MPKHVQTQCEIMHLTLYRITTAYYRTLLAELLKSLARNVISVWLCLFCRWILMTLMLMLMTELC